MNASVRWWALVAAVVLFGIAGTLSAANRPKFQPSEPGGVGIGRYLVTLADDTVADDLGALKRELALLYGARLEANTPAGPQQFAVTMLPSRARLLSSDPRVREVVEVPKTTTADASPKTAAVGLPPATSPPRFTPQPSGFGDNGQSGTYTYDGAGNITAIGADTYRYDTAQRLVSSVTRGVQEDYGYDAFGNRKSATGAVNCLGQTTCAQIVTVDSNTNHLTTINGAAVTYDEAGNIKTIAATSGNPGAVYSYDGAGMMTQATVGSDDRQFLYTADDERIAAKQGASWTWTVRDLNGKVLREFTSLETGPDLAMTNRQWAKDYVWRDGLLLATVTPSGTLHYHLDHLGTPRLVTDANGVKVAEHAYYPFGAEINLTPHETPEEAMKFTGHERDIVAGDGHTLDYMHARFNNASLGRFLSVDPNFDEDTAREPQKWNRYSYVTNNPLRYTDPNGQSKWDTFIGFSNAFLSDFGFTVRINSANADYQRGQLNGDRAGVASGFILGTASGTGAVITSPTGAGALVLGGCAVVCFAGAANAATHLSQDSNPRSGGSSDKPQYKERIPGQSGKEAANDAPSWARGERPKVGESGKDFAKRLMDSKYGQGNWEQKKGPTSEYNQIKKYGDRGFRNPV
jgi:RHS repeat-associated protein